MTSGSRTIDVIRKGASRWVGPSWAGPASWSASVSAIWRRRRAIPRFARAIARGIGRDLLGDDSVRSPRSSIERDGWAPDDPARWCRRCGVSVGPGEADRRGCAGCRRRRMPWRGVVRLGSYGQPLDRALLELKFSGWSPVGEELGLLLAAQLIRLIERAGGSEPTDGDGASVRTSVPFDLVVPVPMPALRRWSRGIDHARVIAEALAAELNLPCRALLRQRGGVDQLAGDRRRRGAVGSRFSLKTGGRRSLRRAPRVLLVDDVLTTGATARACARLLGRGGATVHVAVVAVRDPPERRRGPRKMSPAGVQVG